MTKRDGASAPADDYVGYGHPPKQHQFRDGGVGNPWGRKGKPKPKPDFLEERLRVRIDGRWQSITRDQAMDHALYKEAMAGNVSAVKQLEARHARRLAQAVGQRDETLLAEERAALDRFLARDRAGRSGPVAEDPPPPSDGTPESAR